MARETQTRNPEALKVIRERLDTILGALDNQCLLRPGVSEEFLALLEDLARYRRDDALWTMMGDWMDSP